MEVSRIPGSLLVLFASLFLAATASADVIEGAIYDDRNGAPLASALVRISDADGRVLKEIESGRDGRFLVEGLGAGEYRLAVSKANFMRLEVRASTRSTRVPEGSPSPAFRLLRYGVLSGRVVPARAGAILLLERVADGQLPRTFSATVNSSGEYRFFNIPPGRYVLGKTTDSSGTAPRRGLMLHPRNDRPSEFTFHGGEEYLNVDVVVSPGLSFLIEGKVQQQGTGTSDIVALTSTEYPSLRLGTATVNAATETFRFDGVLPGTYDLLVSSLGVAGAAVQFGGARVSVTSHDVQNVVLPVHAVRSAEILLQPRQEGCSADGTATLTPLQPWLSAQPRAISLAGDRPARIENLAPTRYRVTGRSSRGDCSAVAILDLSSLNFQTLTLSVAPAASIRGIVRSTGSPMPVTVVLRDVEEARESAVQAVLTDSGVNFAFRNLPPGRYCIAAYAQMDALSRWVPETGCVNPVIDLVSGASELVELKP